MTLAERIFQCDSIACLERIELESLGLAARSRREWSVLMTESLLDRLGFGLEERLGFYRRGCAWPIEEGLWSEEDLRLLESKYRKVRPSLATLLASRNGPDRAFPWGSAEAAEIAERCLTRIAPIATDWIEARDAGRLAADFGQLVWSLAHVHALRLGIDPIPEAVLRFFLCRLLEEGAIC